MRGDPPQARAVPDLRSHRDAPAREEDRRPGGCRSHSRVFFQSARQGQRGPPAAGRTGFPTSFWMSVAGR